MPFVGVRRVLASVGYKMSACFGQGDISILESRVLDRVGQRVGGVLTRQAPVSENGGADSSEVEGQVKLDRPTNRADLGLLMGRPKCGNRGSRI